MPAVGPVYQPTTYNVGYESQTEWLHSPRRSAFSRCMDCMQTDECCKKTFIASGVTFTIILLLMIIESFSSDKGQMYKVIMYICLVLISIACIMSLIVIYLRWVRNKRFDLWPFPRKDGSSPQRNGQASILNPSTDLLVTSAQYGPVTEAPPVMPEEDETKNLMAHETKDMGEDQEERHIDVDPRIVLRPPGTASMGSQDEHI